MSNVSKDMNFINSKNNIIYFSDNGASKNYKSVPAIMNKDIESLKYFSKGLEEVMNDIIGVVSNSNKLKGQKFYSAQGPKSSADKSMDRVRELGIF